MAAAINVIIQKCGVIPLLELGGEGKERSCRWGETVWGLVRLSVGFGETLKVGFGETECGVLDTVGFGDTECGVLGESECEVWGH